MQFNQFKQAFQSNLTKLIKNETTLYTVDVDKDKLWDSYLESFPVDERQGFNCNCCKSFIRNYGNIVAIKDDKLTSIWKFKVNDDIYQGVIDALDKLVTESQVTNTFVSSNVKLGTDFNFSNTAIRWEHLYYELPRNLVTQSSYSLDTLMNDYRTNKATLQRALDELTIDATETILDLINNKSLYRSDSWRESLTKFLQLQREYLTVQNKNNYCWTKSRELVFLTGIRNTSIGTLLIDLSNGVELDVAVRKYEAVVSPANYMRTNQVITSKKQVDEANKLVIELGLESALNRRFANEADIDVNNVLFINRSKNVTTNVFDSIRDSVPVDTRTLSVAEISIDNFIADILPTVNNVELLLENKHSGNLVSLITAVDKSAPTLFKWNNSFSWSYNGNLTDSMKERVKAAGGKVDVLSRFSIQWNDNGDNSIDFDAHCVEPNKNHIYYSNKGMVHKSSGQLDVDIITPGNRVAVENIVHIDRQKMSNGDYEYYVHNYSTRVSNGGFRAEYEYDGQLYQFEYNRNLRGNEKIHVVTVRLSDSGIEIVKSLPSSTSVSSKEIWGIKTNVFSKINMISLSPNYWSMDAVGNKHYLFMLEDCINPDTPRSIYNEYLRSDLVQHSRKVFDVLGDKLVTPKATNQLSGVGFSSTQRNDFVVRVNDSRLLRVKV